jgi:hypothetical protein
MKNDRRSIPGGTTDSGGVAGNNSPSLGEVGVLIVGAPVDSCCHSIDAGELDIIPLLGESRFPLPGDVCSS